MPSRGGPAAALEVVLPVAMPIEVAVEASAWWLSLLFLDEDGGLALALELVLVPAEVG